MPTVEEMAAHARELAKAFNVVLTEMPFMPVQASFAYMASRLVPGARDRVMVPPIRTVEIYVVTLHEIGHSCHPTGSVRYANADVNNINLRILEEESAWEWAQRYALVWTEEMEKIRCTSFATYVETAKLEMLRRIVRHDTIDAFLGRRK